jgi:hypothetical protein
MTKEGDKPVFASAQPAPSTLDMERVTALLVSDVSDVIVILIPSSKIVRGNYMR